MLEASARTPRVLGAPRRAIAPAITRAVNATVGPRIAFPIWIVALAVSALFSVAGRGLLPARFSFDAAHIVRIAQQGLQVGKKDQSFIAVGEVYNLLGLGNQPVLTAILSFLVIGALHTVVLLRLRSANRYPVLALPLLMLSLAVGMVYLTTYSKDAIVLGVTAAVLLANLRTSGEFQILVALALYALCFRSYWMLVIAIYVAVRLADRLLQRRWQSLLVPVIAIAFLAIVYGVVKGTPLDDARTLANSIRLGSADATTMINEWVSLPQPWGAAVNVLITLILLVVPIPLLLMGGAYYFVVAILFMVVWLGVGAGWIRRRSGPTGLLATRALALLLAFLATQAVFEPDYGSALRHLSPLLPLVAIGVGLSMVKASQALPTTSWRKAHRVEA